MAAVDYFLKIDGIKGECKDQKHKDEISILSWSWSAAQTLNIGSQSTGVGAGKVKFNALETLQYVSTASADLLTTMASGRPFNAVLTCRKAGEKPLEYLVLKLSTAAIRDYALIGSAEGQLHGTERMTIEFGRIELEYQEQGPDGAAARGGTKKGGWDRIKNHKV